MPPSLDDLAAVRRHVEFVGETDLAPGTPGVAAFLPLPGFVGREAFDDLFSAARSRSLGDLLYRARGSGGLDLLDFPEPNATSALRRVNAGLGCPEETEAVAESRLAGTDDVDLARLAAILHLPVQPRRSRTFAASYRTAGGRPILQLAEHGVDLAPGPAAPGLGDALAAHLAEMSGDAVGPDRRYPVTPMPAARAGDVASHPGFEPILEACPVGGRVILVMRGTELTLCGP